MQINDFTVAYRRREAAQWKKDCCDCELKKTATSVTLSATALLWVVRQKESCKGCSAIPKTLVTEAWLHPDFISYVQVCYALT